jgi:PAS domain S-box-containing protein
MKNLKTQNKDVIEFTKSILYKAFFNEAPIGILIVDWVENKGKILSANNEIEEILGYTKAELETKKFQELTHPYDLEADVNRTEDLEKFTMIKRYFRRDGKIIWIRLTANPIFDSDNNFMFYLSWLERLPNGGNFKVEQDNDSGELYIRSQIKLVNFLQDNWKAVTVLSLILLGYIDKDGILSALAKSFLP